MTQTTQDDPTVLPSSASDSIPDPWNMSVATGHNYWVILLIWGGVFMICFAYPIGIFLTPKDSFGRYLLSTAQEYISFARCLGFMAFAAGLAERVILELTKLRGE